MFKKGNQMRLLSPWSCAAFFLWLVNPLGADPVTAPYSLDFSQYPVGSVIPNLMNSSGFSLQSSGPVYTMQVFRSKSNVALQVTNLAGRDFELSTQFSTDGQCSVGINAFAPSPSFFNEPGYSLLLGPGGLLQLTGADTFSSIPTTVASGDLILRGHYHNGVLDLTGMLQNGPTVYSVTATDTTPNTGQYFGLYADAVSFSGPPVSVNFSHITIVPEPTSAFSLIVLSAPFLRRRPHHFKPSRFLR